MNTLRVGWLYFKVGVLNELQYRVNFFVQLLQSLIQVGTGLVMLSLVYSHTTELNGWKESELLSLLGVQILLGGFIHTFIQPNMELLMQDVQQGTLGHYAVYYRGLAQLRLGRADDARGTFQSLEARAPVGYLVEAALLGGR